MELLPGSSGFSEAPFQMERRGWKEEPMVPYSKLGLFSASLNNCNCEQKNKGP